MTREFSCKYCARAKWITPLDGICPIEKFVEPDDYCEDFKPKLSAELKWWLEDIFAKVRSLKWKRRSEDGR